MCTQGRNHWGSVVQTPKIWTDHPNFFDEECDYCYVTDCSPRYHPYFVLHNNSEQGIGPPTLKIAPMCAQKLTASRHQAPNQKKTNRKKVEAKDLLPNINCTQAGRRNGQKCRFVPGDFDLQTHPSEGPNTSSVWIWRNRYFIQDKKTGNGRFPDNHFPGQDVSRTICINNFEYFGMQM